MFVLCMCIKFSFPARFNCMNIKKKILTRLFMFVFLVFPLSFVFVIYLYIYKKEISDLMKNEDISNIKAMVTDMILHK